LDRIRPFQRDPTGDPEDGLGAFSSETELLSPKAPLAGPWEQISGEEPKRESIERWGALAQDMRVLHAKVDTLSATIRTLTYLTVGLLLLTGFLLFATLTDLATGGADLWRPYVDMTRWR
jgi:hypothetical protein